jgi:hypothetical protein
MEGARCWSVEAKVFEVLVKGGDSGVRIYERSKKKNCSIFICKDEIVWLVGALEEVAEAGQSEVFWDQSRAGFPRLITQKRSNKHGRFLMIEEFDGLGDVVLFLYRRAVMVRVGRVSWWNWMGQIRPSGRAVNPRLVSLHLSQKYQVDLKR